MPDCEHNPEACVHQHLYGPVLYTINQQLKAVKQLDTESESHAMVIALVEDSLQLLKGVCYLIASNIIC